MPDDLHTLFASAAARVADHRLRARTGPVAEPFDRDHVLHALGALDDEGIAPSAVIEQLVTAIEPALVASTGPRYFGFVTGGALPGATAAELLTVGWDQNGFSAGTSPASALVEEVAGAWLKEILGIPADASFGFVTGGQGANTVGLVAGRHHLLAAAGWDVEKHGLHGAPRVRVVATSERHATIDRTLRLLGLGTDAMEPVTTDAQGAIDVDDLARVLDGATGPTMVVLQAGNVNTGAFDDLAAAVPVARAHGAWVHVDGAFGLWAAASPTRRHLLAGAALADSWATDGHKWLNVPYDSGYVFCAHPTAHHAATAYTAAYLVGPGAQPQRSPGDYVLESSRRARGFATWAALRELGRNGIAAIVDTCCARAEQFAEELDRTAGATVLNAVVLNQVLVGFGDDDRTEAVIEHVQRSGEAWMGGTNWHGQRLMRISVSNPLTTTADVTRSVRAIATAVTATG
ncbi:MAG: aspartate aminotransferase family protein [Ilumatobacteraceae bacterium]|nr:aspartate aminotransferase family protein [Ilumatobacteraceae bacterium]